MTTPSAQEQLLLDTHPQKADLYLSIFEPSLAMICQVTGSYDATNQTIDYYNPVSGSIANITSYAWQVALIGTSANDDSLGRTWVRSAGFSTLRFVESDHIDWASATHITVLKYTEIIPIYPRIIQNPSNDEDVIFYKFFDLAYTNQNSILGTFANMGSNFAGFLDAGTGTCYWSASGSSNLLGDNLTYSWIFEGATITGSTAHTPGYVAYNQTGHHRTTLSITSASGAVNTSYRYVSFYNRPGEGNNVPILNWEVTDWGGSRDGIGYSCRIKIRESIPRTKIRDGSIVVIFGEDWYGGTKQSVSNNQKGRETIKFVGYIDAGTIQYSYADGWVDFEAISPTKFMELCEGFSISVESKANPTVWYELIDMDVRRAVFHYLAYQSSVLKSCDVEFRNFTDRSIQYFDADRTSLYDAINSIVSGARGGKVVSDSLGKIWIEQEPDVLSNASSLPTALSISKKDWIGEPTIDERQHQETSFVELGGIVYDNSTNVSTPLLADAPGVSPAYRGKADRKQGWALLDQAELNTMAGNKYAYKNSKYPNIGLNLRGNYNNLDIAPQEKISLTISSGDTPRNISFSNKAFVIRSRDRSWDSRTKLLLDRISVAEITDGFDATTVVIPIEPPDTTDTGGGGGVKQPPLTVPPIPTPGTTVVSSGVNIYHNGVFKGTTNNINFQGPIVDVIMGTITGSSNTIANVIFDDCGCTGTFAVGNDFAGSRLEATFSQQWEGTGFDVAAFDAATTSWDIVSGVGEGFVTGTVAWIAPYTALYNLQINFRFYTSEQIFICVNDVDYDITLTIGTHEYNWTGNKVGCISAVDPFVNGTILINNEYFQFEEELIVTVAYSLTDNAGNHDADTKFRMIIDSFNIQDIQA